MIKLELTLEEAREVVNALEEREVILLDKNITKAMVVAKILPRLKLPLLKYDIGD